MNCFEEYYTFQDISIDLSSCYEILDDAGVTEVSGLDARNQHEVGLWVQGLIDANRIHDFYVSSLWINLRLDVLQEYKGECQHCKDRGYYTKANTVHHVQYVRKHPSLALSKVYVFGGKEIRNLVPLCHACHEIVHGYRKKKIEKPLTEERW